jgi:hypothetical protein
MNRNRFRQNRGHFKLKSGIFGLASELLTIPDIAIIRPFYFPTTEGSNRQSPHKRFPDGIATDVKTKIAVSSNVKTADSGAHLPVRSPRLTSILPLLEEKD